MSHDDSLPTGADDDAPFDYRVPFTVDPPALTIRQTTPSTLHRGRVRRPTPAERSARGRGPIGGPARRRAVRPRPCGPPRRAGRPPDCRGIGAAPARPVLRRRRRGSGCRRAPPDDGGARVHREADGRRARLARGRAAGYGDALADGGYAMVDPYADPYVAAPYAGSPSTDYGATRPTPAPVSASGGAGRTPAPLSALGPRHGPTGGLVPARHRLAAPGRHGRADASAGRRSARPPRGPEPRGRAGDLRAPSDRGSAGPTVDEHRSASACRPDHVRRQRAGHRGGPGATAARRRLRPSGGGLARIVPRTDLRSLARRPTPSVPSGPSTTWC